MSITSYSQSVIATDGNYSNASQGSLSWTMGEVITETVLGSNEVLTQGFQQNYESFLALSHLPPSVNLSIYPNPFSSTINIALSDGHSEYVIYIFDYQNKLISQKEYSFGSTVQNIAIDLKKLPDGFYFIMIETLETEQRIIERIIKTKTQ